MPRLMVGQFCFCGDLRRGIDVGVGEDADGGLGGYVGGVLFVVDGDVGEQCAVEDAAFGWFAIAVEVVEVDQEFGELIQACSGTGLETRMSTCRSGRFPGNRRHGATPRMRKRRRSGWSRCEQGRDGQIPSGGVAAYSFSGSDGQGW